MTKTGAGQTKTKDPRGGWRIGKAQKTDTKRYIRRSVKRILHKNEEV